MARISIKVVPGASRSEIVGWMGDVLKIRIAAPPEKGKANRAVERLLAAILNVHVRQVQVESGSTSQRKVVNIEDLSPEQILKRLGS